MAIVMTLAGAVLIIGASALAVASTFVLRDLGIPVDAIAVWLRWPIAALVATTLAASLYYFLPNCVSPSSSSLQGRLRPLRAGCSLRWASRRM